MATFPVNSAPHQPSEVVHLHQDASKRGSILNKIPEEVLERVLFVGSSVKELAQMAPVNKSWSRACHYLKPFAIERKIEQDLAKIQAIDNLLHKIEALLALAHDLLALDAADRALRIMEKSQDWIFSYLNDEELQECLVEKVIAFYLKQNQLDKALDIAERLPNEWDRPLQFHAFYQIHSHTIGDSAKTIEFLNKLPNHPLFEGEVAYPTTHVDLEFFSKNIVHFWSHAQLAKAKELIDNWGIRALHSRRLLFPSLHQAFRLFLEGTDRRTLSTQLPQLLKQIHTLSNQLNPRELSPEELQFQEDRLEKLSQSLLEYLSDPNPLQPTLILNKLFSFMRQ